MQTVTILDTSLGTDNLGDDIIMDAVKREVFALFPQAYYYYVPTHDLLSDRTRRFVKRSDFTFIGGTNLLSSRMNTRSQWRVRWFDTLWMRRAICLGVGWNSYSAAATTLSAWKLRILLDGQVAHSMRDTYTLERARRAGIHAINTACPTMWNLTDAHMGRIPRDPAQDVVFTLTAWRPDIEADRAFIALLKRHYRRLHFFCQMREDFDYLARFGIGGIGLITPTLAGYDQFLANEAVDYVGTRLHGGIRALQKGVRSLILGVDNRGTEIHHDTELPVVDRRDLAAIERWILGAQATGIQLPWEAIGQWRRQFGGTSALDDTPKPDIMAA
ncbi:MAG TPA: polysaccharide pyruvyl transferase family protein [Stellaceae bacterium]|nr:polysaccharide pyruvyl transferase family protein [Stellaceae bacterium]